ncbi:MAG: RNA polymerase sigma factor [Candidatus Limnocylindria bacterium]
MEGRPLDEDELVELAQAGDVAAYESLVRDYEAIAFRIAYLVTGDAAEAQDASQEAFVKAFRALRRFRRGAALRPWLLRIVANEARNRRRAAGRRAGLALRIAQDRPSGGAAPPPEVAVLAKERRDALLAAVNRLRDDERRVIGYRYFLDMSEADAAAALNWPRGTVKSRLSRAIARLRVAIAEDVR